jgi:5'-nucleotidase
MENKPLIFVTNDDGIFAKGIKSLVEVVSEFGEVVVIAPDKPQSAMGHAITIHHPLRLNRDYSFGEVQSYTCSGTPVDCVKLGIFEILNRKPDLLVSGINHGENTSTNILYSGTMSAAVEGAMEGIPSIGFSLASFDSNASFEGAKFIVRKIVNDALNQILPKHVCLNVNIPAIGIESIKGIKLVRQASAYWEDRFDKRKDPFGNTYYWLTGDFGNHDPGEDTDLQALKEGYVSVVPVQYDLTAYQHMKSFESWECEF